MGYPATTSKHMIYAQSTNPKLNDAVNVAMEKKEAVRMYSGSTTITFIGLMHATPEPGVAAWRLEPI